MLTSPLRENRSTASFSVEKYARLMCTQSRRLDRGEVSHVDERRRQCMRSNNDLLFKGTVLSSLPAAVPGYCKTATMLSAEPGEPAMWLAFIGFVVFGRRAEVMHSVSNNGTTTQGPWSGSTPCLYVNVMHKNGPAYSEWR